MEIENIVVEINHIFDHENFDKTGNLNQNKIILVKRKSNNHPFFLIKKDETLFKHSKKSFINKSEKSFELIHTSVINILGFSIEKPYLYYKYLNDPRSFNDIELSNENIQKMFLGIASGLSYLLSKGYYYTDFSIDSIVFDQKNCPKLIDYINFDESVLMNENDLIEAYVDIINMVIHKKMKKDPETKINDLLRIYIDSVSKRKKEKSFEDFILFFNYNSYCTNENVLEKETFKEYLNDLECADIFVNDNDVYFTGTKDKTVEHFVNSLYQKKKWLTSKRIFYMNSVPEYYIRPLSGFYYGFSSSFMRFFYYEKLFKKSKQLYQQKNDNDFTLHLKLMEEINEIENNIIDNIFNRYKRKSYECDIEEKRIQAIYYLKRSAENPKSTKAKIELAVQYIKGIILPYNLTKSLDILDSISSSDRQTLTVINQMKTNLKEKIQSNENMLHNLPPKCKKLLQEAEGGNILYLLFVGFAFYTGFNQFPVLRSLSIHYIRTAAKKSPYAMYHLGFLYYNGLIFPKNFKRARNCFKRAADNNYIKAEILDGFCRKHLCRTYLLDFQIKKFLKKYHPAFNSMFPNDAYVFPRINYYLESNLNNDKLIELYFEEEEEKMEPYYANEIHNIYLIQKINGNVDLASYKKIKHLYSKKILLSLDDSNEHDLSKEELCRKAKNFFNGDNNYPVNYSIALDYFKLAADKGDSEAQWRYAMMVENSLGTKKDSAVVLKYFHESAKQNNTQGKFLYALLLKKNDNVILFEQLINECCSLGYLDAMYFYAMHLEKVDKKLENSLLYYQKAADSGHLDSLIRLIYILKYKSETKLYEKYLNLSVSLFNESLLIKLINLYDKNKKYDQSNILIEMGIKLNFELFNFFYADHLLYGKGMPIDVEKAKKIVFLAYEKSKKKRYLERYQYIILDLLILNNEHEKAVTFLIKNEDLISIKYRNKFLLIYSKLDKNIARDNFITINFCYKEYRECHSELMNFKNSNSKNFLPIYDKLCDLIRLNENPYAMVILGRLYKNGTYVLRNLKKAVQYFVFAAKKKCPEGYYYLGKEYYYGRILNQDFKQANRLFIKALKNNGEPRAGYYLYKIETIYINNDDDDDDDDDEEEEEDEEVDVVNSLIIAANFGYKRALYKYGHRLVTGRDPRIEVDEKKGENLIMQAAYQNHKKAIRYCKSHGISYKKEEKQKPSSHKKSSNRSSDEDDSLSDILNLNENDFNDSKKNTENPDQTNINKDGKKSSHVNDAGDEKNSDSDSTDISGLKFWS